VNKQCVQPVGSFVVDGLYIHAFDLFKIYDGGYYGWYRVHDASLRRLAEIRDCKELEPSWMLRNEESVAVIGSDDERRFQ
jgi:hypothetical protein